MSEAVTDDQNQASERPSSQELAAKVFGANFHGEVPAPAETDGAVEGDDAPAEEPTEDPAEEVTEDPGEEASGEPAEEGDDSAELVSSYAEFVEAEGLDPEFMEGLNVAVKVNGEIREIPFSQVRAHAQMNLAADDALEQAKAVKKQVQDEQRTMRQNFDASVQVASAIAQRSILAVQADQKALEESGLDKTDPAEYAAQKIKLQERAESEKAQILQLAQSVQAENARREEQRAKEMQQEIAQGAERLIEAIPAWGNPETAKRESEAVVAYVTKSGLFTEQQVRENTIPGLWVLAHKARLYDESQGAADVTKKRLRKVPKVAKPGAPKSPEQANAEQAAQAKGQIRQATGTTAQIQAAVRARQLSRRK